MLTAEMQEATGLRQSLPSKNALRLADQLEFSLLGRAWPEGLVLGSEVDLRNRHGVAPPAMRQALRILEWRGLVCMRRGAAGGLMVQRPTLEVLGRRLMALHLLADRVSIEEVQHARQLLLSHLPETAATVSKGRCLMAELFRHIEGAWVDSPAMLQTSNRALRIAQRILQDGADQPGRSGTIDDMMERYSACRAVIIQAMRMLEDLGMAASTRGRTGGFRLIRPSPSALARAALPHFVANGLDLVTCNRLIGVINKVNAMQAAVRECDRTTLGNLAASLREEQVLRGDVTTQFTLLRHIAAASGHRVLHMLVRCLWYFWYCRIRQEITAPVSMPVDQVRVMVRATNEMVGKVLSGDPQAAGQAMVESGFAARSIHEAIFTEPGEQGADRQRT